jgi:hypothetical protein
LTTPVAPTIYANTLENKKREERTKVKPEDLLDYGAVALVLGVLLEALPVIASVLSIVWLCLRIYTALVDIKRKTKLYHLKTEADPQQERDNLSEN